MEKAKIGAATPTFPLTKLMLFSAIEAAEKFGVGGFLDKSELDVLVMAAECHFNLLEALKALLDADVAADAEGLYAIKNSDTESGEKAVILARAAIAKAETE